MEKDKSSSAFTGKKRKTNNHISMDGDTHWRGNSIKVRVRCSSWTSYGMGTSQRSSAEILVRNLRKIIPSWKISSELMYL